MHRLWTHVSSLSAIHRPTEWKHSLGQLEVLDNESWLDQVSILRFLQDMGHSLRLSQLLSRDTVRNKMDHGDGMSFAEFTYPLIQAWDWWHLFNSTKPHTQVQIGGSDQYGNLVTGMDAVKSLIKYDSRQSQDPLRHPIGFTVPLLTTAAGQKFGKSAGNAVWLDKSQTKVFDLYGYFVSTPDDDVKRLLKLFTFLSSRR
jgi:tyrosyl-tRNA synthetase